MEDNHGEGAWHGFNQTELAPDFQRLDLPMAALTVFLTLLAVLFNALIFYVFWGMRKSASALIFLNLAAVDVVLACLVMPYSVLILLTRGDTWGAAPPTLFCALSGCLFETSVLCTVGFILLASADRFLGVYHHVLHRRFFSRYNLTRMILSIWIVSPLLILLYVCTWLILTPHGHTSTFTNLRVFTVCMGQYWLRREDHVLGNVPSYLTMALLSLLVTVILVGNLAVLKQLFRKKPLGSLHGPGPARPRRNNCSVLAPPLLLNPERDPAMEQAKEQLKRISRAEQDVRKSDRIFQTDSHGDVTGININAIMKLYVRATRRAKMANCANGKTQNHSNPTATARRKSTRSSPRHKSSADFLKSESGEALMPPTDNQHLTPCPSTVGGSVMSSVIEEGEEEEEEEEEDEVEEDPRDEELEFELSEEEIEEELAVLAVESPIGSFNDNDDSSDNMSLSPEDDCEDGEDLMEEDDVETIWKVIKFVAALKRNSKKRTRNWDTNPLHSKSLCNEAEDGSVTSLSNKRELVRCSSDSDLSLLQETRCSTPDLCANGSESPVTRVKPTRKYSEISNAYLQAHTTLPYQPIDHRMRSPTLEEIDELVNGGELSPLVKRSKNTDLAALVSMVTQLKRRSKEAKQRVSQINIRRTSTIVDAIMQRRPSVVTEENGYCQQESEKAGGGVSWGTMAVIAKMRSKLHNKRGQMTEEEEVGSAPPQPQPPQPVSIALNTITEEEDPGVRIRVPRQRTSHLAIPTPYSPSKQPAPAVTTARTPPLVRTNSLDQVQSPAAPQHGKRRRGGFLINHDDMTTPSPSSSMFGTNSSHRESCYGNSAPRDSCYVNTASSFTRRMRASMSMRNSLNITSVTQMVYNFNKHAQKKKKEIRAAKTILILVFYYIFTLLLFVVCFYHVSMLEENDKPNLSYWLTFYAYIIYLNAVLNPVIHFWRNAKVRHTVLKILCPKSVNEKIKRWKLRGGFG